MYVTKSDFEEIWADELSPGYAEAFITPLPSPLPGMRSVLPHYLKILILIFFIKYKYQL
jgi:hypothetical protein